MTDVKIVRAIKFDKSHPLFYVIVLTAALANIDFLKLTLFDVCRNDGSHLFSSNRYGSGYQKLG